MNDVVGYIGGICFAISAIPQAVMSCKEGHSKGLSDLTLWLWLTGEVFTMWYVLLTIGFDKPLILNYGLNTLTLLVIMYYKYFPRREL